MKIFIVTAVMRNLLSVFSGRTAIYYWYPSPIPLPINYKGIVYTAANILCNYIVNRILFVK